MKTLFGLGNPGPRYELTRHNVGFLFLDYILEEYPHKLIQENSHYKHYSVIIHEQVYELIYPLTYMNLSGSIVHHFVKENELNNNDFIIVYDDFHLPFGKIRLRPKGSHAGHNGIRNITDKLESSTFNRLRIGIDEPDTDIIEYVLGEFSDSDLQHLPHIFHQCDKAIQLWNAQSFKLAMDNFNGLEIL